MAKLYRLQVTQLQRPTILVNNKLAILAIVPQAEHLYNLHLQWNFMSSTKWGLHADVLFYRRIWGISLAKGWVCQAPHYWAPGCRKENQAVSPDVQKERPKIFLGEFGLFRCIEWCKGWAGRHLEQTESSMRSPVLKTTASWSRGGIRRSILFRWWGRHDSHTYALKFTVASTSEVCPWLEIQAVLRHARQAPLIALHSNAKISKI